MTQEELEALQEWLEELGYSPGDQRVANALRKFADNWENS